MTHVTYSPNELCSGLSRLLSIIMEPSDSLSPSPRPHGLPSQPHCVAPTPDLGLCSRCIKDNPGRSYLVNVEVFTGHLPCTTWQCAIENRQGESSLFLERKDTIQHWHRVLQSVKGRHKCCLTCLSPQSYEIEHYPHFTNRH